MRTPLIAGNWKMNNTRAQAKALVEDLVPRIKDLRNVEVCVCPPYTALDATQQAIGDANVKLGAQNVFWEEKGAWTSQISADMLLDAGCTYVIIGHSETRGRFGTVDETLKSRLHYFGETDQTINTKAKVAFEKGLKPIVCCGETIDERKAGSTDQVIADQIRIDVAGLSDAQVQELVIAYEPVWAIGTGEVCDSDEADRVCGMIRGVVGEMYGQSAADAVRILYGGSMNDKNAAELLAKEHIDGGLVGGAALKAESFSVICKAAAAQ